MKKTLLLLAAIAALICTVSSTRANTITPFLVSITPVGGGFYDWTYDLGEVNTRLSPTQPTFFTINDFGPVVFHNQPLHWAFTQAPVGPNGCPLCGVPDNTHILNVTFTWTGVPTDIVFGTAGPFVLRTNIFADNPLGFYTDQDLIRGGRGANHQFGNVDVPQIPDGGSAVALLGIALTGIEGVRRVIRRRKA